MNAPSTKCRWGVIDTHKNTRQSFVSQEKAIEYYMKNCQDGKNCWGIFLNRPKKFWPKILKVIE